jgi:hypothetical protein
MVGMNNNICQPRPDQPKLYAGFEKGNTVIIIVYIILWVLAFGLVIYKGA